MSKKKRIVAPPEQETQLDLKNEAVAAAIDKLILPPMEGTISAEEAVNALTKADREALAGLGDSPTLVRKIIEQAKLKSQQSTQAQIPTRSLDQGETEPKSSNPRSENENTFGKLLDDQVAFESAQEVAWSTSFRKIRELGRGGQGVVYLIKYLDELGGEQALKTFSAEPYGTLVAYREEMQRMARVASVVNGIHHDNLLDVEHFFDFSGCYVMIMQLIHGYPLRYLIHPKLIESLKDRVGEDRWEYYDRVIFEHSHSGQWCFKPGVAVNIIEKCLRGLSVLHEGGLVHADIKPSNIMLDRHGSIKLIDIGSAFALDSKPKKQTWTPIYAAPEVFERREWTQKSDIASLGYVLIELLTGQPAVAVPGVGFESTRSDIAEGESALLQAKYELPQKLDEILPQPFGKSEKLMTLLRRLIDPDPQNRFSDTVEAIEQGTYVFRQELAIGNLEVYRPQEIKEWIQDVIRVEC